MSIFHCASPRGRLLTSDHFISRELCQHFMFLMGSGGHWITKWRYINVKILVPIKQKLGFHPWPEAKQLFIHTWLKAKQSYVECLSLKIFIKREKLEVNEFWNIYFFDNSWTHHEWGFFKCVKGHKAPISMLDKQRHSRGSSGFSGMPGCKPWCCGRP